MSPALLEVEPEVWKDPDLIFHFSRRGTVLEKILKQGQLGFSHFRGVGDPLVYREKIHGLTDWSHQQRTIAASQAMVRDTFEETLLNNVRYLSFCENKTDETGRERTGLFLNRMWAQYGDNHEGCCLVFSKQQLLKSARDAWAGQDCEVHGNSVVYLPADDLARIYFNYDHVALEDLDAALEKRLLSYAKGLFFTKTEDYSDENEFRIAVISRRPETIVRDTPIPLRGALKAVVLGSRFDEVYLPSVHALAQERGVTAVPLRWRPRRFQPGPLDLSVT